MPYKDPEAKRRYMSRYYKQKIQNGRDSLYGLSKVLLQPYGQQTQAA